MGKKPEHTVRLDRRPAAPGSRPRRFHLGGRPAAIAGELPWWTGSPTFLLDGHPVARAGDLRTDGDTVAPYAPHADADAGERRLEVRCEGPQGEPLEGAIARCLFADHAPRERAVRAGKVVFADLPAKRVAIEVQHPHLVQEAPVRVRCRRGRSQAVVRLVRHHLGTLCEQRGLRLVSQGEREAHWHHVTPDWDAVAAPGPAPPPILDHHQPVYDFATLDARVRERGGWPCVVGPLVGAGEPWWCRGYVEARLEVLHERQDLRDPAVSPATQAWREALTNVVRTCVGRYAPPEASHGFLVSPTPTHGGHGHIAWPRVSPVSHSWGRTPRVLGWHFAAPASPLDGVDEDVLVASLLDAAHRMTPACLLVVDLPTAPSLPHRWKRLRAIRRHLDKAARKRLVVRWPVDLSRLSTRDAEDAIAALPKHAALWLELLLPEDAAPWCAQQRQVRRRLAPLFASRRVIALALRRDDILLAPPAEIALQGAIANAKAQRALAMLPRAEAGAPAPWIG